MPGDADRPSYVSPPIHPGRRGRGEDGAGEIRRGEPRLRGRREELPRPRGGLWEKVRFVPSGAASEGISAVLPRGQMARAPEAWRLSGAAASGEASPRVDRVLDELGIKPKAGPKAASSPRSEGARSGLAGVASRAQLRCRRAGLLKRVRVADPGVTGSAFWNTTHRTPRVNPCPHRTAPQTRRFYVVKRDRRHLAQAMVEVPGERSFDAAPCFSAWLSQSLGAK